MSIQRRHLRLIAALFVALFVASGCGEPRPSESLQKAVLTGNLEQIERHFHAGTDLDLSRIMAEIERMEKKELGSSRLNVFEERYQIFLFLAILLLLIEFFIPERVKRKEQWRGRFE